MDETVSTPGGVSFYRLSGSREGPTRARRPVNTRILKGLRPEVDSGGSREAKRLAQELIYGMSDESDILAQLMAVIEDRKVHPPPRSYTTSLFEGGVDRIGAKLTEEAGEAVEAAAENGEPGRQHLIREAADVLYHLFVLMAYRDVSLQDVQAELGRRFGISGLDEKAARSNQEESPE